MTNEEQQAHDTLADVGRRQMREILGETYCAQREASTNAFNAPLRRLSEEFAYGSTWTRASLNRRDRSLVTLGMLCALGKPAEIRLHVVAALNNGVSVQEVSEVFTHAAVYCGIPAAIEALKVAEATLRERGSLE